MLLQAEFLTYIKTTADKVYCLVIYYLPINDLQDCKLINQKALIKLDLRTVLQKLTSNFP